MRNSSKIDFQIDCDDALVENQNKCVGDNWQTWKCEIVGEGLCSIFKSRFQRHHLVYEKIFEHKQLRCSKRFAMDSALSLKRQVSL